MKVALVCDWLTGIGGAERVVVELHKLFPQAPIYTSQYDAQALPWFKGATVRTTNLQKLSKATKKFLPVLRARAFGRLDLSAYDLVISSSGAEAKGVKTGPNSLHICYCHAPTHYYWSRYEAYLRHPGFGKLDPLARLGLKTLVESMRRWDYQAAQRPDLMVTNSTYTKNQIKKYYKREATVIPPPVDVQRFRPNKQIERIGFVTAGRQTPYKRIDLAVAACTKLNLPLTVIGNGPEHQQLRNIAGPSIKFVTDATDADMPRYFQQAQAFIFPGVDDFGIVAVEALAAGTPVIAYKEGGSLDYVIPNKTGGFFEQPTPEALATALAKFDPKTFDHDLIIKHAQQFAASVFQQKMRELINQELTKKPKDV